MNEGEKVITMRIYLSSTDKYRNSSLFEEIVLTAKQNGIAGSTVFRGIMGFGASSKIHSQKLIEINDKIPVVVEIVDTKSKISDFLKIVDPLIEESEKGCLITFTDSQIISKKRGKNKHIPD